MKVNLGDIFKIPFEGQDAICKVVWISEKFEDCLGFVVFSKLNDINQTTDDHDYKLIPIYSGDVSVLYGDIRNISKSRWPIVAHSSVTEQETRLIFHNIAGKLYCGDNYIKELSEDKLSSYPKFLRAGDQAIINMLKNAFNISSNS